MNGYVVIYPNICLHKKQISICVFHEQQYVTWKGIAKHLNFYV